LNVDHATGDISFYEDTGTTPKFFWDASAENLGIGGSSTFTTGANIEVLAASVARLGFTNTSTNGSQWAWFAGTVGQAGLYDYDNSRQVITADSSGNVGIGKSSPTTPLDVSGAIRSNSLTIDGGSNRYIYMTSSDGAGQCELRLGDTTDTDAGSIAYDNGSDSMQFRAGAAERMRIDSSGNVGIGTTSPDTLMHLSGNQTAILRLENPASSLILDSVIGGIEFEKQDGSGAGAGVAGSVTMISSNSNGAETALTFGTSSAARGNNSEAMRIDSSGNVGIGTSSPGVRKLVVKDSTPHISILANANTEDCFLDFGDGDDDNRGRLVYANSNDSLAFYTAASEKMRLDSAGNLLVGKTATSFGAAGIEARSGGTLWATASGTNAASFNRLSTDGPIAYFSKDGTALGSISSRSGNFAIESGDVGLHFNSAIDSVYPSNGAGGLNNGAIDLGYSSSRFKDLYLSGGVYLGGTGAANKLDDYEEGTFTPTLGGGATATSMSGTYTKVGRLVTITLSLLNSTITGSPNNIVSGLPFTNGSKRSSLIPVYHTTFNTTCETVGGIVQSSSVDIEFLGLLKGAGWTPAPLTAGSGRYLHVTASYETT